MVELGRLEKQHQEFTNRQLRLVVVSNDNQTTAQLTQKDFPHLVVVADKEQKLAKAVQVIHAGMGRGGEDTNAPTTFLVDGAGKVKWFFRPDTFVTRLTPEELLAAIDAHSVQ